MADAPSKKSARPQASQFDAFEPFLRDYATNDRILEAARQFSPWDDAAVSQGSESGPLGASQSRHGSQIVIDETALVLGFISVGLEVRGQESTTAWFVAWLEDRGADLERILQAQLAVAGVSPRPRRGIAAVPSDMVRDRILPAAVELALRSSERDRADARHLLMALLDKPGGWPHFTELATPQALSDARRNIVEHLEDSHEEGENLDVWRGLVAEPSAGETVGTLSDAPALVDALGREAFAEVLAIRIKEVSKTLWAAQRGTDAAFIIHIDGPWGSGKTSILNFLKGNLGKADPPWLIVEFNAWQNQQRVPAWWPIISHVGGAVSALSWFQFPRARWIWLSWNLRMRWVPLVLSVLLTGLFFYFGWQAVSGQKATGVAAAIRDLAAGAIALGGLAGIALTTSRSIFFGSKNAADAYVKSTAEPFRPIIRLYERLVRAMKRPVAVFIDDIDRCDSSFVIDLLEGIQTLLRSAPVVYVVAGDRKWICSSFEKRYCDFCAPISMPGRPLGYLFLDKVFQLSTAIPRLSNLRQAAYWKRLLETGPGDGQATPETLKKLEADAERDLKGKTSHEDIQQEIDRTEEGSIERETIRAAAAKQITSPEAIRAAEHRLQPLAGLLEPNPRSMKRLVNAYGLNHARAFLEGRTVEVETLARWTIIELRWPILADYLASNWSDIAVGTLSPSQFPEGIRALLADSDVKEVFGSDGQPGHLTKGSLSPILE